MWLYLFIGFFVREFEWGVGLVVFYILQVGEIWFMKVGGLEILKVSENG